MDNHPNKRIIYLYYLNDHDHNIGLIVIDEIPWLFKWDDVEGKSGPDFQSHKHKYEEQYKNAEAASTTKTIKNRYHVFVWSDHSATLSHRRRNKRIKWIIWTRFTNWSQLIAASFHDSVGYRSIICRSFPYIKFRSHFKSCSGRAFKSDFVARRR